MQKNSKSGLAVAVLFSLLIFLPILGMTFPAINVTPKILENRQLAEAPTLNWESLSDYPKQFENYFNDHFGYRNLLIRLNSKFKRRILDIKTSEREVLEGIDGWLYYTGNTTVDDYRGVNPFTPDQLEQWQLMLEGKRDFLKLQGIEYLFVVAPNKSSIYPEYLPAWVKKVSEGTPLDQLVAYLKENSEVEILDLRHHLMVEKSRGFILYTPTDTHWNQLGAFVAYREIMAQTGQLLNQSTALSLENVKVEYAKEGGGDLAKILGIQEDVVEELPTLTPLIRHAQEVYKIDGLPRETLMQSQMIDRPRVVMFGDSFSSALIPYISEDFSYARYILAPWTKETPIENIVIESKPDIVIEERVERLLNEMSKVSFGLKSSPSVTSKRI